MDYLAFPLEIERTTGALSRTSVRQSIAGLIDAAARTPPGPWCGCEQFGFSDLIEKQMRSQPGVNKPLLMKEMADRLNHVFERMAASICKVQEIRVKPSISDEALCVFEMNISWKEGDPATLALIEEGDARWT